MWNQFSLHGCGHTLERNRLSGFCWGACPWEKSSFFLHLGYKTLQVVTVRISVFLIVWVDLIFGIFSKFLPLQVSKHPSSTSTQVSRFIFCFWCMHSIFLCAFVFEFAVFARQIIISSLVCFHLECKRSRLVKNHILWSFLPVFSPLS